MSNNIVKHSQLHDIAGDLWTKAKKRDIEALTYDPNTKTLKGTNSSNADLSVSTTLTDLVSINDRAKFTKDVSVNDAGAATNINIGNIDHNQSKDRIVGYRGLTSKNFVDNYVEKLVVHTKSDLDDDTNTTWKVWSVKKGTNRDEDRIVKAYHNNSTISALSKTLSVNGVPRKCIEIPIREEFNSETYFLVKCTSHPMQVVVDIKQDFRADVVNISEEPSGTPDSTIRFNTNSENNTVIMHLVGRESISSLAEKLRKTQADGSNYVLQSETTVTGGAGSANKVARLDNNGKLNADMLPSIAINEYIPASAFTHEALRQLEFQNGDIIVVTANGKVTRYLCVDKAGHQNNLTEAFIPLNDKEGIVFSVNEQRPGTDGNVTVTAEHIKIAASSTTNVKQELDKKISNITLKTGDNKKLTVTKADGQTSDVDLTEAFKASNVTYGKPIAGTAKATVDAALDALNEEVNKGIKTIKGGRPGTNGDMNVTVAQGGATGITMTFGDGGTSVEIATYMTTAEVNEIKSLFT